MTVVTDVFFIPQGYITGGYYEKTTFLLILCFAVPLSGCQKRMLAIPEYPLSAEAISEIAAECALPSDLEIEENEYESHPEMESASFILRSNSINLPSGHLMGILSHAKGDGRSLGINVSTLELADGDREEACKQVIVFATRLFGGFTDEMQIDQEFSKAFSPSEDITWEASIEGWNCRITYTPDRPVKLLVAIYNDMDGLIQPITTSAATEQA